MTPMKVHSARPVTIAAIAAAKRELRDDKTPRQVAHELTAIKKLSFEEASEAVLSAYFEIETSRRRDPGEAWTVARRGLLANRRITNNKRRARR